jgi:hypothetical protein
MIIFKLFILQGLKWSLQQALPLKNSSWKIGKPVETEKRLLISLMMTIGEWCMKLPMNVLVTPTDSSKPALISSLFEVRTIIELLICVITLFFYLGIKYGS